MSSNSDIQNLFKIVEDLQKENKIQQDKIKKLENNVNNLQMHEAKLYLITIWKKFRGYYGSIGWKNIDESCSNFFCNITQQKEIQLELKHFKFFLKYTNINPLLLENNKQIIDLWENFDGI